MRTTQGKEKEMRKQEPPKKSKIQWNKYRTLLSVIRPVFTRLDKSPPVVMNTHKPLVL